MTGQPHLHSKYRHSKYRSRATGYRPRKSEVGGSNTVVKSKSIIDLLNDHVVLDWSPFRGGIERN